MIDEEEVRALGFGEVAHVEPPQNKSRSGTPEREFRALISSMQTMIGTMQSLGQRLDHLLGDTEVGERHGRHEGEAPRVRRHVQNEFKPFRHDPDRRHGRRTKGEGVGPHVEENEDFELNPLQRGYKTQQGERGGLEGPC